MLHENDKHNQPFEPYRGAGHLGFASPTWVQIYNKVGAIQGTQPPRCRLGSQVSIFYTETLKVSHISLSYCLHLGHICHLSNSEHLDTTHQVSSVNEIPATQAI